MEEEQQDYGCECNTHEDVGHGVIYCVLGYRCSLGYYIEVYAIWKLRTQLCYSFLDLPFNLYSVSIRCLGDLKEHCQVVPDMVVIIEVDGPLPGPLAGVCDCSYLLEFLGSFASRHFQFT